MKYLLLYSKLSVLGLLLAPVLLNKRGQGWLPRPKALALALFRDLCVVEAAMQQPLPQAPQAGISGCCMY